MLFSGGGEFVLRLGSTAILARLISPDHFGLFMMVSAVTAIADQFRDLGLSTATIQRERITHDEVSTLFWINTAAGLLIALAVCALAPLVALYFHEPRLTAITAALSSTLALGGLTVQHEALLGRQMRLGAKSGMRLLAFFLSSLLAVLLAFAGWGYWALVWREILRSLFIMLGAWTMCRWIPGLPRRDTEVGSFVKFGSGLTASYMLGALTASLDRLILGRFQGAAAVGLYRQSYQLVVTPMAQLMGPLYQVALPGLSMLQGDHQRFREFFTRIVSTVATVSMPLSVFLALYAEEVSDVLLGDGWLGAATFIRIFGLGGMLQSVYSTIGFVLVSRGRSGGLLILAVVSGLLKAVLMTIGLRWGAVGVAIGDVSTTAIIFVPFLVLALKNSPVSVNAFLAALARPLTASILLAGALFAFRSSFSMTSPLTGLISGLLLMATLFPVLWVMLPGGRVELQKIRSAIMAAVAARPASASSIQADVSAT